MLKKRVEELPKCDFANLAPCEPPCSGLAQYDAPVSGRTSWAFMCEGHYKMFGNKSMENISYELVHGIAEPLEGDAVEGIEPNLEENIEYWENVILDGIREITCPECGEERRVEPDATGIFNCDGCGIKIKCPEPPM